MFKKNRRMQNSFYQQGMMNPNMQGMPGMMNPDPMLFQQGMQMPSGLMGGMQGMPGMQMGQFDMPNYDLARLQTEINENRRQLGELLKRIVRIENYLGIRGEVASEYDHSL